MATPPSGSNICSWALDNSTKPIFSCYEPLMGEDWLIWTAWSCWPALPSWVWVEVCKHLLWAARAPTDASQVKLPDGSVTVGWAGGREWGAMVGWAARSKWRSAGPSPGLASGHLPRKGMWHLNLLFEFLSGQEFGACGKGRSQEWHCGFILRTRQRQQPCGRGSQRNRERQKVLVWAWADWGIF